MNSETKQTFEDFWEEFQETLIEEELEFQDPIKREELLRRHGWINSDDERQLNLFNY